MDSNGPPSSSAFRSSVHIPNRRRVWQACTNCRNRKTRCDAAKPKCSLCATQGVDCIYKDSQQPRIENNTKILLERIQMLEDRIFSTPGLLASQPLPPPQQQQQVADDDAGQTDPRGDQVQSPQASRLPPATSPPDVSRAAEHHVAVAPGTASMEAPDADAQIPIPLSHTANANHVLEWPIVRELLSSSGLLSGPSVADVASTSATDVFFERDQTPSLGPPESWKLSLGGDVSGKAETVEHYQCLIDAYFDQVNIFFPLLSRQELLRIFQDAISWDGFGGSATRRDAVSSGQYCLLLLVLCMGSLAHTGRFRISLTGGKSYDAARDTGMMEQEDLDEQLWQKAELLLGFVSSQVTLEAAQCTMLASLYTGARGRVSDSFFWSHSASIKCEALVKRVLIKSSQPEAFSEALRRLYWVALIYEGDFVSEISVTLPSGISRYEDVVPYPDQRSPTAPETASYDDPSSPAHAASEQAARDQDEELVAFQISTNAAIRRFLNRVNSVVYDSKDQSRMTRTNYANWLLRITQDLWSYHGAVYRNLPDFLLTSQPPQLDPNATSPSTPGIRRLRELSNNPWNVLRLEGRYYAGQYIIHRPFIEYVLLNSDHFQSHPCRGDILDRSRLCLQGCRGFINVFDVDPVNSVTCLFAAGMVTFTMVVILRVATVCTAFQGILPPDIDHAIVTGKNNLRRFAVSVKEFEWHLQVLQQLEFACERRAVSAT